MGILDDGYELPHTGLALCDDCGRKVSDLFHELYMADPGDDLEEISKKFEKKLEVADFSDEMKSFIKKEFFLVVKERKKNDPNLPKRFSAGFGELKEIALAAGKKNRRSQVHFQTDRDKRNQDPDISVFQRSDTC